MDVAIIGLGVVGKGVYDIITNDLTDISVKYVLELDEDKTRGINCVAESFNQILEDDTVSTVIELIGGTGIAYKFVKEALTSGKNVVTANKALISKHFKELHNIASISNVSLRYEASVGGAINIIDPLLSISEINKINKIEGIINGSTNFILSKIFKEDASLIEALNEATNLGYIETGSTDDLEGLDLLRKINILSMISYKEYINESDILRIPLSDLTEEFYSYVKSKGLLIKYIATSDKQNNEVSIHLEPVIITKENEYNFVNYEDNIITLYGEYHLKQSFKGQGAGRYPTASAVVYDLLKQKEELPKQLLYKTESKINNDISKYHFLIIQNNEFIVSDLKSMSEIVNSKDIKVVARIGSDAYEVL